MRGVGVIRTCMQIPVKVAKLRNPLDKELEGIGNG